MRRLPSRVGLALVALWRVATITFFLPRLARGNPAEVVFARLAQHGQVNPAALKALELEFGVNTTDPLWVQYLNYLNNLVHGNLGVSTNYYPTPVIDIISQDIKWTL